MKKQMATLFTAAALTLWALPALAASPEGVQLTANGSNTTVALTLPQYAGQQGVTSLQLSFTVQGGDVEFDFADGLPATVQEYRCKGDTLTLYLSGRDQMLADNSIQLGQIRVTSAEENAVTVTFQPESLQMLNAINGDVSADALPEAVAVMTPVSNPETPDDDQNGNPGGDQDGSQGGNQDGSQNGSQSGSQNGSQNGGQSGGQNGGQSNSNQASTQKAESPVEPTSTPVPDPQTTLISPVGGTGSKPATNRTPVTGNKTESEIQVPGTIPTPSATPASTAEPQADPDADADSNAATAESALPQENQGGLPILPIAAGVVVLAIVIVLVVRRFFF